MPLPANARLQAAQSFARDLRASAEARHARLLAQLREARELLRWNPAAGRPARFLQAQSAQGRALAERARAQAAALGLPELRELVLKPHVLLYAHDENRVFLLALKHERPLSFGL
ncbi:MAG: hypothetical protein QM788_12075 [Roseateles sp.]|uniref:hypothetical protein n=1 Tax=Roseateles sp. TaxID=1971397 RepID=UPI0039EBF08A